MAPFLIQVNAWENQGAIFTATERSNQEVAICFVTSVSRRQRELHAP